METERQEIGMQPTWIVSNYSMGRAVAQVRIVAYGEDEAMRLGEERLTGRHAEGGSVAGCANPCRVLGIVRA